MSSTVVTRRPVAEAVGFAGALVLVAVAMAVPWVFDWSVHVRSFPPLHAGMGAASRPSGGDELAGGDAPAGRPGVDVGATGGGVDGVADRGAAVGAGAGGAAGPDETTIVTDVPTATRLPAAGSVRMTAPAGTVGSGARVVEPTRRPAEVIATMASDCGAPATSGTITRSRAVDTVGSMLEPAATGVPGPGSWLMTVPSG